MKQHIETFLEALTARTLAMLAALAAAVALAAAFLAQYGFGLHPCELCLAQRYPYAAIVAIGVAAYFVRSKKWWMNAAWLCAALFAIDTGLATYHAGVELGWFPGPSACSSNSAVGESIEDMRRALMEAPLVPCDQPMAHILGLSLAAWNALFAAAMTVATLAGIGEIRKKTQS